MKNKYVVSLVLNKQNGSGITSELRSLYVEANSAHEALGLAIGYEEIKKLYALSSLCFRNIDMNNQLTTTQAALILDGCVIVTWTGLYLFCNLMGWMI